MLSYGNLVNAKESSSIDQYQLPQVATGPSVLRTASISGEETRQRRDQLIQRKFPVQKRNAEVADFERELCRFYWGAYYIQNDEQG